MKGRNTLKTYFVVSDIHGFYDELMKTLSDNGFDINNKEHIFISCGDLLDRGPQAPECLQFVNSLPPERKILIRGNHETLLRHIITKRYFDGYDFSNGTVDTISQLTHITFDDKVENIYMIMQSMISEVLHNEAWNTYYESTVNFAEFDNHIFTHGWIPCDTVTLTSLPPQDKLIYKPNWRDCTSSQWDDAMWVNGMKAWNDGVRETDKTIVCGHWHTSWGHMRLHNDGSEFDNDAKFDVFYDDGIIALDACTVHSKQINCIILNEDEI